MGDKSAFSVHRGFPPALRRSAAQIYFEAFEGKLGGIMGRDGRGLAFIERVIDPHFSICATTPDGSSLLGIAGFKTAQGAMVGGEMHDLAAIYGWFGALWRGPLFSVLEREVKPGQLLMDGIAVSRDARGGGIGTALLDAITVYAEGEGLSEIRLDVIDTNPRARALYERKGFVARSVEQTGPFSRVFGFASATSMVRQVTGSPSA